MQSNRKKWRRSDFELQTMVLMGIVFVLFFCYVPMVGLLLAFKDGNAVLNITNVVFYGEWVGFSNFEIFLKDKNFLDVIVNTLGLNCLQLLVNFPAPILFALLLNEIKQSKIKRSIQTVLYLPYFLSWVIFGGIILSLLRYDGGVLNELLLAVGAIDRPINYIAQPSYYWAIIILSSFLKNVGWGMVIYLAAIAGIDGCLYEAAELDGANRWQKMRYVTLPCMAQTITLFLILNISNLLDNGTEQILVFQNTLNLSRSEVIDTYILKYGINRMMYSLATAIGLFKSVISVILLVSSNALSKKLTGRGIF